MSRNEQIYKNWIKQIDAFEKLSFDDARVLYQSMIELDDEDKRHECFNRLIEGTLYVVAKFITRNKFSSIDNVNFDMDDVINSCSELWIKKIKDGFLLKKNGFFKMFDTTFYKELSLMLVGSDLKVADLTVTSTESFSDLLYSYIEFTQKNGDANYEEFLKIITDYFGVEDAHAIIKNRLNSFGLSDIDLVEQTYELFEGIIEYASGTDKNLSYTKRKLDMLKYILLNSGLQRLRINTKDVYEKDVADRIVEMINYKELIDAINNCRWLSDRSREIVYKITGSNDEDKINFREAAKMYGVSEPRVRQIYYRTLRYIRWDGNVKKCL